MKPENRLIDKYNMVGQTFRKWTILEYVANGRYKARCECGHESIKQGSELRNLRSTQCVNCRKKEIKEGTRRDIEARARIKFSIDKLDISNE
jgi:hypothetical protein